MSTRPGVVGWDIGGVNTKAVRLSHGGEDRAMDSRSRPLEMQRRPEALADTLLAVARELGAVPADRHAVTMTAELSQAFRSKREGVGFVLDALETAFPGADIQVYTVAGRFVKPEAAREIPLLVGAANWAATANLVARWMPTCMLIDTGSTSTDIIPIVDGEVAAQGRTDPERLLSGELVYTGALRTPVESVASRVPLWGRSAAISADGFAIMGDVHLWLGHLPPEDYTCPTPDGRPPAREFAGERLARVVCADREMLQDSDIEALAASLAAAQVRLITESVDQIRQHCPPIPAAVVAGVGDFIAARAACAAGMSVLPLAGWLGPAARVAPAAAVAKLLPQPAEPAD